MASEVNDRITKVVAIDWSGAKSGARKKIWLAEAGQDRLLKLEDGRNRVEIADHLIAEASRTPEFIVGFDFAFSLPSWFFAEHNLRTVHELWALAERDGEGWLATCEPPFWGRPGKKRPDLTAHFRHTDRSVPAQGGIQPKSVFQIGGAGAVGTGSLRGMPILRRLHSAGFSIWPFDPPGWPRVVEIYPRILTGPVTKSSGPERLNYLHDRYPSMNEQDVALAASSEDAFDAAVSALLMASFADELQELPVVHDPGLLLEGVIWHPGVGEG